jgi:hypothetical protein
VSADSCPIIRPRRIPDRLRHSGGSSGSCSSFCREDK